MNIFYEQKEVKTHKHIYSHTAPLLKGLSWRPHFIVGSRLEGVWSGNHSNEGTAKLNRTNFLKTSISSLHKERIYKYFGIGLREDFTHMTQQISNYLLSSEAEAYGEGRASSTTAWASCSWFFLLILGLVLLQDSDENNFILSV